MVNNIAYIIWNSVFALRKMSQQSTLDILHQCPNYFSDGFITLSLDDILNGAALTHPAPPRGFSPLLSLNAGRVYPGVGRTSSSSSDAGAMSVRLWPCDMTCRRSAEEETTGGRWRVFVAEWPQHFKALAG